MKKSRLLGGLCFLILFFNVTAHAALITADPDSFPNVAGLDVIVTNAFPGVTLTATVGTGGTTFREGDPIYSTLGPDSYVFGFKSPSTHTVFEGLGYRDAIFRADFDTPTDFVSVASWANISTVNESVLHGFNSDGVEVATIKPPHEIGVSANDLIISHAIPDIAYIEFTGRIQEMTYNFVPIPATLWLFGTGLLGLIGVARRKPLQ